jgi:hypothetical protein
MTPTPDSTTQPIEQTESPKTGPICPHCEKPFNRYRWAIDKMDMGDVFTSFLIAYCPHCLKVIPITCIGSEPKQVQLIHNGAGPIAQIPREPRRRKG